MLHTIPITLDISKVGDQKTVTGIRQNDTNTVKFSISLVNGSDTFDINNLTTPTVIMFGIKPDGKVIVNYADIVNGHIEYTLKAQDTTAAGTVKWQVGIFEGLSTKYATPRFSSVVEPAVVGDEEIESTNSLDVLLEAIDEVNSLMSNNNITCRYSFMFDSYGRIFSYTNRTSITNNSFAQYANYQDMISKNHFVWIASNVTNVANGSLGDKTKVQQIICEAKQKEINFNEYSDCNISYGTNALLQFYTLSSLSRLLAEKVDRPVGFDDLDAVLQNQIEISLKSFIFIVSSISMLEMIRYCDPYRIHTLTLTSSAATFFGVESGTRAELRISGSWGTFLTREIRILETSDRWVQIVEGTESEHSFGTWVKVDPISDGAVTEDKLDDELADKINDAIDDITTLNSTKLDYVSLVSGSGQAAPVNLTQLNALVLNHYTFYFIWLATNVLYDNSPSERAIIFELEGGSQFVIRPNGEIYSRHQSNSNWGDFTKTDILNPSKVICFDTNGCISSVASLFPTHSIYTVAKSVYVPSNIGTIPDSVLTLLPNVDVYYVDCPPSAVTLGTDVQTAVQNEDITIYYKGEFNLADLLVTSQKKLNDRLTALESQVGGLINGDEVSY